MLKSKTDKRFVEEIKLFLIREIKNTTCSDAFCVEEIFQLAHGVLAVHTIGYSMSVHGNRWVVYFDQQHWKAKGKLNGHVRHRVCLKNALILVGDCQNLKNARKLAISQLEAKPHCWYTKPTPINLDINYDYNTTLK